MISISVSAISSRALTPANPAPAPGESGSADLNLRAGQSTFPDAGAPRPVNPGQPI
jgi:hypothetical protein